jgi:hypothetical protein
MLTEILVAICALVLAIMLLPVLYDYSITESGVKILLFRIFPIYEIPIHRINDVTIETFSQTLLNINRLFALRAANRFQRQVLVVEKAGWPRWVYLTPKAPEQAFERLKGRPLGAGKRGGGDREA